MWKTIEEFPNYMVNEFSVVMNKKRNTIVKTQYDNSGYKVLQLYKDGKRWYRRVHRIAAIAFIPNPDNFPEVNHIDGDKSNNYVDNFEWCTQLDNLEHAKEKKLLSKAAKVVVQYDKEGNYIQEFESATLAAAVMGCHVSSITNACGGYSNTAKGYVWRYANVN